MKALLWLTVLLCGCNVAQMGKALEAGRTVVNAAEPCFVAQQDAQLEACDHDPPCEAQVKKQWEPIADALDAFHDLWCGIDGSQCAPPPVEIPPAPPKADPKDAKPPKVEPPPAPPKAEPIS